MGSSGICFLSVASSVCFGTSASFLRGELVCLCPAFTLFGILVLITPENTAFSVESFFRYRWETLKPWGSISGTENKHSVVSLSKQLFCEHGEVTVD